MFEKNARLQVTTWGENGEIMDYADKHWSTLMSQYYKFVYFNYFLYQIFKFYLKISRLAYFNIIKIIGGGQTFFYKTLPWLLFQSVRVYTMR